MSDVVSFPGAADPWGDGMDAFLEQCRFEFGKPGVPVAWIDSNAFAEFAVAKAKADNVPLPTALFWVKDLVFEMDELPKGDG